MAAKRLKHQPIAEGRPVGPSQPVGIPGYDHHALAMLRDNIDNGTVEQRIAAAQVVLYRPRGSWA
jgi:hypothetical protein